MSEAGRNSSRSNLISAHVLDPDFDEYQFKSNVLTASTIVLAKDIINEYGAARNYSGKALACCYNCCSMWCHRRIPS